MKFSKIEFCLFVCLFGRINIHRIRNINIKHIHICWIFVVLTSSRLPLALAKYKWDDRWEVGIGGGGWGRGMEKGKKEKRKKEKKLSKDTSYLPGPPLLYFHLNPLIPLQLAKSALGFWMYPKTKAHFFRHLAIPGFPLSDHTVSKPVQWPVACQM